MSKRIKKLLLYAAGGFVVLILLGVGSMEYTSRASRASTAAW